MLCLHEVSVYNWFQRKTFSQAAFVFRHGNQTTHFTDLAPLKKWNFSWINSPVSRQGSFGQHHKSKMRKRNRGIRLCSKCTWNNLHLSIFFIESNTLFSLWCCQPQRLVWVTAWFDIFFVTHSEAKPSPWTSPWGRQSLYYPAKKRYLLLPLSICLPWHAPFCAAQIMGPWEY